MVQFIYAFTVLSIETEYFYVNVELYMYVSPKLISISCIAKEKPEKINSGFSGIRTRDLCDTGAVLYQLSYEAITVGSWSILVGSSCHFRNYLRINRENLS